MAVPPDDAGQAQLRAEAEQRLAETAERKERLLEEYGPSFGKTMDVLGVDDEQTKKLGIDNMAQTFAEKGFDRVTVGRDGDIDNHDYMIIAEDAYDKALKTQELPDQQPPEKPRAELFEPAAPVVEPTQDAPLPEVQDPGREAEATPERPTEQDPVVAPAYTFEDMKREHAEIVANRPQQEQAAPPEMPEKQLSFYEDRQPEPENAVERRSDRTDAAEAARSNKDDKQLAFFEDQSPYIADDIER